IGHNLASKSYVKQKQAKAKELGIETSIIKLTSSISKDMLKKKIEKLNSDKSVHGIIIQRPLPSQIDKDFATKIIVKAKDVDGFLEESPFESPMGQAVSEILKQTTNQNLKTFLKSKKITVIGKGETGGRPAIKFLKEQGIGPTVIDTKTENPKNFIRESDIIISTVGKPDVIKTKDLKQGVILVGIGMHKNERGEFETDYNQKEVGKVASFYTPVPGGVGPVTVAMLLKNVVKAAGKR
ncbi:MAG: bifunctional 5,10-methylene-tetrahydrofolate dehydrogenase/5,10-methylene-tetrahydrofolate cyclohydrolase, partial [uncultured bacterium]